jgi:hypothetical protein
MSESDNQISFIAITASFIDANGQFQHLPLALSKLDGRKSSKNQAGLILRVIDEYNLRDKA